LQGVGPDGRYDPQLPRYNRYLNELGYAGDNPWHDWANAAAGAGDELASGWAMRNAAKPARVAEADAETPYMTRRAIDFIREAADAPWCLHLSYIKPHWPYIAPAPYHAMYAAGDILPVVRSPGERANPHPSYREFMNLKVSKTFSRDEVRAAVIPVYMGLIKQIDDQLGGLFGYMQERGLFENTMIVFTSDHGDYLGDHWLGEKDLFHEPSVKVPLIVYDPSTQADPARGMVCDALVEAIDLAPTFLEAIAGDWRRQSHRLEGRSLLPWLRGEVPSPWRQFAVSEYNYASLPVAEKLGVAPRDACLFMITDRRWKLIHAPASGRCCMILKATPASCATLAPMRPARASGSGWPRRSRAGACACRSASRAPRTRSSRRAAHRSAAAS